MVSDSSGKRTDATSSFARWLPTHLRTLRGSWVFVLVALLGLVAIVEGIRTLAHMRTIVVPGVNYNLRREVIPPLSEPARAEGIAGYETLIAVNGRQIATAFDIDAALTDVEPGQRVPIIIEAPGESARTVTLVAQRPDLANALLKFLAGAAFVALGLGLFWFHPGHRASWPFMLACVAFGVLTLTTFAFPRTAQTELTSRLSLSAAWLTGPLFLHMFLVFPRPLRVVLRRRWLLPAIDAFGVGCAVGSSVATELVSSRWFIASSALSNAIALVLAAVTLAWRLRRPASAEDRSKLRALLTALLVAFPVSAATQFAISFRWWVPEHNPHGWTSLLLLAFPAIVGFAIARRNLLDVDRTVARMAAVSAIVGALTLVFVAIALALPRVVASDAVLGSPLAMATVVVGGFVALWPVQKRLLAVMLSRFTRGDLAERLASPREVLADLADDRAPARFGRFERRLEEAAELPEVALIVKDDAGWQRPSTGERVDPLKWPLVRELSGEGGQVLGALALGRPGSEPRVSTELRGALDELANDVARALAGSRKGEHIGDYKIERFLAAGGMGNVYVGAKHGAAGFVKPVAIKQLLPEMAVDKAAVERFLGEARLVARLTHPGIVQTLELGETDRGYFIAMELVDGIDAATLMRRLKQRRERLPLSLACHIVTSACMALDHAHRATDEKGEPLRLVHHDVSPHNLLVDVDGNVKLADFGVAHVRHDRALPGVLVGKVGYMAPEQLRGEPPDRRVDVFAAGVVLYELVTGQHPFASGSDFLTLSAVERGRFLPPETIREDCPLTLALTIERALAVDPAGRHASAAAFADAIQAVVPLASRNAAELGALVRRMRDGEPGTMPSVAPPRTLTLPTGRG